MSPHIGAVLGDVDRNVTHDVDAVTTTAISHLPPLPKEFELGEPVKLQLRGQFLLPMLQGRGVPLPYSRIPMDPGSVVVDFLACHEECIVLQPFLVFLAKDIKGTTVRLRSVRKESPRSLAKEFLFEGDHSIVGHMLGRKIRSTSQVRGRQKTFLTKSYQIYEQRISGKCREALIRRIAVSGGVQRQNLPDFLP